MAPESWQHAKELLAAALAQPSELRTTVLESLCKDPQLRAHLEEFLKFADAAGITGEDELTISRLAHTVVSVFDSSRESRLLSDGEIFGSYRVVRSLGRGGMGHVYEAEHRPSGRRVALKMLNNTFASDEARRRFIREGQLAGAINHPNVVFVFQSEEIDGIPVIAMELVPGGTLRDRVEALGPLPVTEAVDALLDVIDGLEAASRGGILHRDVKPSNCFVDEHGRVKIGDFGLSISPSRDDTQLTAPGTIVGTPAFCSPEQLRGEALDERSDIYSVAATLYFALTGRPPLEHPTLVGLLTRVLQEPPKAPQELRPAIPQALSRIVLICLAKFPVARIGSYRQLRAALVPFSSRGVAPAPLPARVAAALLDAGILMATVLAVDYGVTAAAIERGISLWRIEFLHAVANAGVLLSYFGFSEGLAGRSAGKWMFSLSVARTDGAPAGLGRAFVRTSLMVAAVCVPGIVANWPARPEFIVQTSPPAPYVTVVWPRSPAPDVIFADKYAVMLLIAMFVPVRRRNGFAGIHEIVSGTRVVEAPTDALRATVAAAPRAQRDAANGIRVGPYLVPAEASAEPGSTVIGYDPQLSRPVWIHYSTKGAPVVGDSRRDAARLGRPRWLAGSRESIAWDAYEFAEGLPLVSLQSAQPWRIVRVWLNQLAEELVLGFNERSLPALGLDRLWVTVDGQVKLLDWPQGSTPHEPIELSLASPRVTVTDVRYFLHSFAMTSLEGAVRSAGTPRSIARVPLPLGVRAAFGELASTSVVTLDETMALVKTAFLAEPEISQTKRLLLVAMLGAAPALLLASGLYEASASTLLQSRATEESNVRQLLSIVESVESVERGDVADPDRRRDRAAEMLLGAWMPILPEGVVSQDLPDYLGRGIRWADRGRAAFPNPSPEQLRNASAQVFGSPRLPVAPPAPADESKASLARRSASTLLSGTGTPLTFLNAPPWQLRLRHFVDSSAIAALFYMTFVGLCGVCVALLVRRGLATRLLRLNIVTNNGDPASRARTLCRAALLMTPAAIVMAVRTLSDWEMAVGYLPDTGMILAFPGFSGWSGPALVFASLILYAFAALDAVAHPTQSILDRITGTALVPE